jgi:hypothetical protein
MAVRNEALAAVLSSLSYQDPVHLNISRSSGLWRPLNGGWIGNQNKLQWVNNGYAPIFKKKTLESSGIITSCCSCEHKNSTSYHRVQNTIKTSMIDGHSLIWTTPLAPFLFLDNVGFSFLEEVTATLLHIAQVLTCCVQEKLNTTNKV